MRFLYLLMYLLVIFPAHAEFTEEPVKVMSLEAGAVPPTARIEDISWLEGHWIGAGFGGTAEDVISAAADGQMMGMFRQLKSDGTINFYEFYVFAEKDGSLTQRLKHFSPPLAGWEEKDEFIEFQLVAIEERSAYFDGLTYVLADDGSLTVGVRIAENRNAFFQYRRAPSRSE
jgi:hypothetical protein